MRRRAAALPPDERRAAIVDAALPLVIEHGVTVTTRQIAEAADIAEGTIFRVFADKQELLDTVVEAALDPAPELAAIEAIDPGTDLEERLADVVAVLQRRVERVWQAMTAVGVHRPPPRRPGDEVVDPPEVVAIAALLAGDADRLRLDPLAVARLVRSVTFATTHPALADGGPASPDAVVALLLDGLRAPTHPDESAPC